MPDLLGDERVGIRYAINGLISMTPDGHPLLGETPEVKRAVVGRGELDQGGPGLRPRGGRADVRPGARRSTCTRPTSPGSTPASAPSPTCGRGPARASTRCTASSTRPSSGSPAGRSGSAPCYQRDGRPGRGVLRDRRAGSARTGTPRNEALLARYAGRLAERTAEWDARWWSPVINAEHLAMRDACGLVDLSAFAIFDITGPAALDAVQSLVVAQADVRTGRVIYTSLLDPERRVQGGPDRDAAGRASTSGWSPAARPAWRRRSGSPTTCRPGRSSPTSPRRGPRWACGARGPGTSSSRSPWATCPTPAFGFGTCREVELGGVTVLASRISYVGELGWELYVPMEQGARVWDAVWDAGAAARPGAGRHRRLRDHRPAGKGVPRLRQRADPGLHPGRGRDDPAAGEGAALRRQGGLPGAAGQPAGGGDVHADRGRPHLGQRPASLHARR